MSNIIKIVGMVDPHTHLRDLDWSHKATFYSETCAAVAGGYWAVFDMPNTKPSTINRATLDLKLQTFQAKAVCDWGVYAGASQSDNTTEYASMWQDTCGLKIFNNSTTGDLLIDNQPMRDKHYQAWVSERIIAVHAEEETVLDILEMVRKHNKRTHFLHICTAKEIDYLRQAKAEGLPITVGVCPHHLYLIQDDEQHLGAYAIMKPSLKTQHDVQVLWEAIADGTVDIIESDHAPHTHTEKQSDKPPFGVTGLETNLPLTFTAVAQGRLSLERAVAMLSTNVHKIWGISVPEDTYTLIDIDAEYTLDNAKLLTACGWTPFHGMPVVGKVLETWIRGVKAYDGEKVLVPAGFGRNLFGETS
jgi:dihydroorotase-like cyclic amidohydrolase